jgi:cytoskeletal protein CcmA (bactofilin family)
MTTYYRVFNDTRNTGVLDVQGATTLGTTLDVTGNASLTGQIETNNVEILLGKYTDNNGTKESAQSSQLHVFADFNVYDLSTFYGNVKVIDGNTFTVENGDTSLGGSLAVTGAASLSSSLAVTGAASLSDSLAVTGAATLSDSLAVTGAATLSSSLAVTGAATLSDSLAVTGAAEFKGDVTVDGSLQIGGTLTTVNQQEVNITESFMMMNHDNTASGEQTAGFIVNSGVVGSELGGTLSGYSTNGFIYSSAEVSGWASPGDFIQLSGHTVDKYNGVYHCKSFSTSSGSIIEFNSRADAKDSGGDNTYEFCLDGPSLLDTKDTEYTEFTGGLAEAKLHIVKIGAVKFEDSQLKVGIGSNNFVWRNLSSSISLPDFESKSMSEITSGGEISALHMDVTGDSSTDSAQLTNGKFLLKLPTPSADEAGQEYTIYNSTFDVDIDIQVADGTYNIDKASSFIIPVGGRMRFASTPTEYFSF